MGTFVNPGNERFVEDLNSKIYVDKSDMVAVLNEFYCTRDKYICMSRARRFGKTMMTNLIAAYYSKGCNSRGLFERLKLATHNGWDRHLNSDNVIMIDVNYEYNDQEDKLNFVSTLQKNVVDELKETFANVDLANKQSIASAIAEIFKRTGETFVIIMDEYDVLFRDESVEDGVRKKYLELINALFKSNTARPAISLAYLTGILPIARERVQSNLNNFKEFTMLDPKAFAPYFGFSAIEVRTLCQQHGMDYDRVAAMYDGYLFPSVGHVFNPNSVVNSMMNKDYDSYWNYTSSFEAITCYIDENDHGIQDDIKQMLEGGEVEINTKLYKNTITDFDLKDKVFTYLIHLGYLALVVWDGTTYCRIPNGEVGIEWFNAIQDSKGFALLKDLVMPSLEVVKATLELNAPKVASALDIFHTEYSSALTYNLESSMQSAILMAYFAARRDYMAPIAEFPAGLGFADIALVPKREGLPAIIVELKKSGSPEVAINQIKSRNYATALRHHPGKGVILVGISYNPNDRHHQCLIEKIPDYTSVWK